jgi:pimeloyl-ACP methyl ester carboxylesterase
MRFSYCIWAFLVALSGVAPAAAQQAGAPAPSTAYTVFLRGTPIGREDVTVREDDGGLTISSSSRFGMPVNVTVRNAEIRYRKDWTPEYLVIDATVQGLETNTRTSFLDTTALTDGILRGQRVSHTDVGSTRPFVLPNVAYGSYAAIGRRLTAADIGSVQGAFVVPMSNEAAFRVDAITNERMQIGTDVIDVRLYTLAFANPAGPLLVNVYADTRGGLLRLTVPAEGIDVVRDDLAASTSRTMIFSNPGDEAVVIPSAGFNLGATLTRPTAPQPSAGYPAVILISGSSATDRDGAIAGVPIMGQLAGAIADAGYVALRFDRRGTAQSGGRSESATISDFAEDARAVARWLANRRDIDRNRIAVLGHGEGAWIAMQAAARESRIRAVVAIAAPGTSGSELVLEQQQQALDEANTPPAERAGKVDLQRRINAAVVSGRWTGIPADVRAQADTPWFESLLTFDPSKVLEDVDDPILFVHGQLDREIPVAHLDRISEIARAKSDSKDIAVVSVRGVNHLLLPAVTGQMSEYVTLQDRTVSRDVSAAVTSWLQKTFAAIR